MTEPPTVLPANADDALAHLRSAAASLAQAERRHADAVGAIREAVMAARLMKVPWEAIGKELGVSRQAVTERFGGDARAQLVLAWNSIEVLLAELASVRAFRGRPLDLLRALGQEGVIPDPLVRRGCELFNARSAAVHGSSADQPIKDVDQLVDVAVPLAGLLWLVVHGEDNGEAQHTPGRSD